MTAPTLLTPYIIAAGNRIHKRYVLTNPLRGCYYIWADSFISIGISAWIYNRIPHEYEFSNKQFASIDDAKTVLDRELTKLGFILLTDEQYAKYQLLL